MIMRLTTKRKIKLKLHRINRHIRYIGHGRILRLGLATAILFTAFLPVFQQINFQKTYALDAATLNLVGQNNQNLVKKFSYDATRNIWQFNKDGGASLAAAKNIPAQVMAQLQAQVGGGGKSSDSLYSVDLNADPTKGITYYDNNTNLSFTMVPNFKTGEGREQQGRIVYPFGDGGKLVYTAKNNGMKEDIVLSHNISDTLIFSYKLNLPETLVAKIMDNGSVGIYSADLALFQASAGNTMDSAKLEDAQRNGDKNHLVFGIPAPVVIQSSSIGGQVNVKYSIENGNLTVTSTGLSKANYPLTIDPSVVITSSSDFMTGNNEGNIDFETNQISRGTQTGGGVGSWSAESNSFTTARYGQGAVTYNGRMYLMGGCSTTSTCTAYYNDTQYSSINSSDGTIGSWTTASNTFTTARSGMSAVTYNGYMYILGGRSDGTTYLNDVQYAAINSDGSLGTWSTTSSFTTARYNSDATVYEGYIYIMGGNDTTSSVLNDVQYAAVKADGTLGSWASTSSFTNARTGLSTVAYNGFLYMLAGMYSGTYYNDVQYAAIKADGTISAWVATTSFTTGRYSAAVTVYNGYIYIMGGKNSGATYYNDVQYSPMHSSGTLGPWITTSSFSNSRSGLSALSDSGYLFLLGGINGSTYYNDIQYAKINGAGEIGGETSATITSLGSRNNPCVVTYNGYIYSIGGYDGTNASTTVYRSTIDASTGNTGSWSTTSALGTAAYSMGCGIYDQTVYVFGGTTTGGTFTDDIQYASINSNGTLGTWTTDTTPLPETVGNHQAGIYNGYVYVPINTSSGGGSATNSIVYAAIDTDGSIVNTWTTETFGTSRNQESEVIYAGYIYVIGGANGSGTELTNVQYAKINSDGSIGTWGSTASLNDARSRMTAVAVNGYMYVVGGEDGSGDLDSIEFAKINSDGTLGTWAGSTIDLSVTRARMGMAAFGDKIYLISGRTSGTRAATSQYFTTNTGGSQLANSWASNSPSISSIYASGWAYGASVVHKGYVYIAGGQYNGTRYADVYYAPINTDGSLGSWTASTYDLNISRYNLALVVYNGYIYAIAGQGAGSTRYDDYEYAKLSPSGGELASGWTDVTSGALTTGRGDFAATAYNGYMYVSGGVNSSNTQIRDVNYAQINSNGTLGSWTNVSGSSCYTTARGGLQSFAYNGYLYILGGTDGTNYLSDVQYIALNSNGSLNGSWKYADDMPTPRAEFGAGVANGYAYFYSGTNSVGGQNNLMSAEMAANGSISNWAKVNTFTNSRYNAATVINNGFIYIIGGRYPGGWYNDIQYTGLRSMSRKAEYSKLIDFGAPGYLSSISYNGNLPDGLKVITYKTAGSNGIFGSLQLSDNISIPTEYCGIATERYVWLKVTLYDGGISSVQPDVSSDKADITDITINYNGAHPTPNVRLYGGKYFKDELQQPLDTCKP